ncbi:MAG: hypothetical protein HKM02_08775 [Pseudomonadales bacterium]|nr:hypothetical protein [Pseudomonadales bacterium]
MNKMQGTCVLLSMVSVGLIGVYLRQAAPLAQVQDDQPLDLAPAVAPAKLLASNRDLGQFPTDMVPMVNPVAQVSQAIVTTRSDAEPAAATVDASLREDYRHDMGWWQHQDPNHWVVQVLGAGSEAAVVAYISGQPDASLFSYYEIQKQGQAWFVVVFGDFSSRELATGIAETHDFGSGSQAFAKSVTGVISDLTPAPVVAVPVSSAPAVPAAQDSGEVLQHADHVLP